MKSVSIGCLGSETLTRRTATVTISAPEASTAAAFCSNDLYLPVPTISREEKVRPATVQLSSAAILVCAFMPRPYALARGASPSADEGDEIGRASCRER